MKKITCILIMGLWISICNAAIINVPSEQPTIQAGIDAAIDGDTVLVADGVYTGNGNRDIYFLGKAIVLKSVNGPEFTQIDCNATETDPHRGFNFIESTDSNTILEGFTIKNGYAPLTAFKKQGGAIFCTNGSLIIKSCVFIDNYGSYQGGAISCFYSSPHLINCTFFNNGAAYGGGIYQYDSHLIVENCIIAFSYQGAAVYPNGWPGGTTTFSCCDLYDNQGGDWLSAISDQLGVNGNINEDPVFCDTVTHILYVKDESPCASINTAGCGPIGAYDYNCNSSSLDLPQIIDLYYLPSQYDNIIDVPNPIFSWMYYDTINSNQAGFELQVGTDNNWADAEMWSTEQIFTTENQIQYSGVELQDLTKYYLRIRVYNGSQWGSWTNSQFKVHFGHLIIIPDDIITIQEGIDWSKDGDTVLVRDGLYTGVGNVDILFRGKKLVLVSEHGPRNTVIDCQGYGANYHRGIDFICNEDTFSVLDGFTIKNGLGRSFFSYGNVAGAILCDYGSPKIQNCIFRDNNGVHYGGAILCYNDAVPIIRNCDFVDNKATIGSAIQVSDYDSPLIENCIFAFNKNGDPCEGSIDLFCCNVYGNETGDWVSDIADQFGINGNISVDPQFCSYSDYHLNLYSECNAHFNSDCGLIGALSIGCPSNINFPLVGNQTISPAVNNYFLLSPDFEIGWYCIDTIPHLQIKYEIEIGSDSNWDETEIWSSGAVETSENTITYLGPELADKTVYYTRIRLFNGATWGDWAEFSFMTHFDKIIHVPSDYQTLQSAVDAAVNYDTVFVDSGVYVGTGNRNVDFLGKAITVKSIYGPGYTTIDCDGFGPYTQRAFIFQNGEQNTSILEGFTIREGFSNTDGGAIICTGTSPIIRNCIFKRNRTWYLGGAILLETYSEAKIENCSFEYNAASITGGAIACKKSSPIITGCTFVGDSANYGGAINYNNYSNNSLIENCTFIYNCGREEGACIRTELGASVIVNNSIFAFNFEGVPVLGAFYISCSDIFGNLDGNWVGNISTQYGMRGNISCDPSFCDLMALDVSISDNSPCTAQNSYCGELIGAGDVSDCQRMAVISIDHSGSMFYTDPLGVSRLERARALAHSDLDRMLKGNDPDYPGVYQVAIQYFNASGIVLIQEFSSDSALLHNAIDAIPGPKHDTPLAAAMCQAHCRLDQEETNSGLVITYTDGLENESQNFEMCTICESCNEFMGTGWNFDCDPTEPANCTEWQICLNNVLTEGAVNVVHYFGEPINPFDKSRSYEGLEDMYFLKSAAENSAGGFFYHSDQEINGYLCGDANSDNNVNIADAIYLINFVFLAGTEPVPYEAGNVNCDSSVNVSDAVYIINHVFAGGNSPCDCK